MHATRTLSPEAEELHSNLAQQLGRLRFTAALETPFLDHLRSTQTRSALFTLCIVALMWVFYAVLDFWRLHELAGTGHAEEFFWRSMVLRWLVLVCFGCAIYGLVRKTTRRPTYEYALAGSVLACCLGISASSYTLKNLDMPETSVVMVLIVSVAFFPLGVRFRIMAWIAAAVCTIITLSGPALLRDPADMQQHWVLSAVMWLAFVLSGVTAYYREKGLREQFLLRRLLNWEASHDPLTGLANRRMFHEHLDLCMRQAHRERDTLYLAILDIDHFKLYNDHYGHNAGDEVLRQFAGLLQRFAQRPMDLAVRLGGEEFALVIYGVPTAQILPYLQQIQTALAVLHLPHHTSPTAPYVTVSMGAAAVTSHDTQDSAFQRADGLLYQAKRQGRNQACVQSAVTPSMETLVLG